MNVFLFFRGVVIGLSVAAVVGPMSVLCMQRTLNRGFRYGLVSGLGVASADGLYSTVAGFGLTVIASFLVHQQFWIRLIGGVFLLYLGVRTFFTIPARQAAVAKTGGGFVGAYLSTFLLTLTNPLTILSFVAIFAGIGVGGERTSFVAALLVVGGVFLGSATWWLMLTGGISLLRGRFKVGWLLWINRGSGIVIALFGLFTLLSLRG